MLSVTPFVPISLARVKQQSEMVTPGLQKVNLVAHSSWDKGSKLPRGNVLQISPLELQHQILFRSASRIAFAFVVSSSVHLGSFLFVVLLV